MKIVEINGSPRKNKNTAQLLDSLSEGAQSIGAEVKRINLFELSFHDCYSCFACKRRGGTSLGRCAYKDDLKPLLDEIHEEADALVVGSPVYFSGLTGDAQSFMNRLCFQYIDYSGRSRSVFPRTIPTALILSGNGNQDDYYEGAGKMSKWMLENFFGPCELLYSKETWQFPDYDKYVADFFDVERKKYVRDNVFPKDLSRAFELGRKIAER